MSDFKKIALDYFIKKDYMSSMAMYANALNDISNDEESKIGILMCDMALSNGEEQAHELFDYYYIIKQNDEENAYNTILDLVENSHQNSQAFSDTMSIAIKEKLESMDGILFSDLKSILEDNNFKKEVFENMIFSSKIIIVNKDELIDFISLFIKYGLKDTTDNYLENLIVTFRHDKSISKIIKQIRETL